ncbi:alpha/beta fold hydrolase [Herbaspirillum sp. alder98]|uniref:alpha/beta fold hydrolase n=1 Tax=Herbaspirillum sp. alder98 TaxID=2913096 RepID=UPI001CD85F26|nr:alpha/beta hydrolase [Herbaspirillum sp. alder98]MCA1325355.1 alpha/beta hydrolase [Herbaspirillum sp. alder98]
MINTFHRVGNGPHPVIVLHGWFGDAHSFQPIEPWLSGQAFSYIFMDYRGYGGMKDVPGQYTIEEIASDALALADTLGFDTFSLVGHSMGGMAMERIAILAPRRVRALFGISPVPCGGISYEASTRRLLEDAAENIAHRETIIDRSTGGRLPRSWIEWKAAYSLRQSSPDAFSAYFRTWADTDFTNEIRGQHTVKVVVGRLDPTFNAELMAQTYLRRYAHSTVDILEEAGHYPMNETPLALVAAMESFLIDNATV